MADITEILRQLAYYRAGGGKPTTAEEFGKFLTGTGQALGTAAKGFETGLELQKKRRENFPLSAILKNVPEDYSNLTIGEAKEFAPFIRALKGTPDIEISPAQQQLLGTEQARLSPSQLKADVAIAGLQKKSESQNQDVLTQEQATKIAQEGGKVKKGTKILPSPFGSAYAQVRQRGDIMRFLPSQQGNRTPAGQAYQMQLYVNRGKSLLKPNATPQELNLVSLDIARAIQGGSPQLDTIRGAGFSNNLLTEVNRLGQNLTANPNSIDAPRIRQRMFEILSDLENVSKPFIAQSMAQIEANYQGNLPSTWEQMKKNEMEGVPTVPFQYTTQKNGKIGIAIDANGNKAMVEFDESGKIKKVLK